MDHPSPQHSRGRTLALGLGTTVAMWAVAYISMMKPGLVWGEALFALLLLLPMVGGFIAGGNAHRQQQSPIWEAVKVGLTVALLNLMIVGSMLIDPETRRPHDQAGLWIAGNFGFSIVLTAIGGWIGAAMSSKRDGKVSVDSTASPRLWHYRFMCVAACAVLLLLITGGLVTGFKAGMAVPDWPNSFGHNMLLYPASQMVGGVFYEHAHRLYGMLVGVTAILVAVSMFKFDSRAWMRVLGVAFLLGVSVQGVLGGTRVTETSVPLAIVHGVVAQLLFATIVCMAAFSSPIWNSDRAAIVKPGAATDRTYSLVLLVLMIVQLGMGAMYRHLHRDLANPPEPLHPLYTHIGLAGILTLLMIFVAGRAWGSNRDVPVLPALGRAILLLLGVQLLLGVSAMTVVWMSDPTLAVPPLYELVVTTAHQITGAMLLATVALLMFWTRRLLVAPQQ